MQKAINLQAVWLMISKEIEAWESSRFITKETFGVLEKHHRGLMNDISNRELHRVGMSAIALCLFTERNITQGAQARLTVLLNAFRSEISQEEQIGLGESSGDSEVAQNPPIDDGSDQVE